MADRDEGARYLIDEAPPPPTGGARLRAFGSALAGTALLVGLIAGGVWWTMDLGERQAESLPVFRAGIEPTKSRPKDPGGVETPYQRIKSYEVATGGDATGEGRTQLAPQPAAPAEEDVTEPELEAAAAAEAAAERRAASSARSARSTPVEAEARAAPARPATQVARRPDPLAALDPARVTAALPGFEPEAVPDAAAPAGPAPNATPLAPVRPRQAPADSTAATTAPVRQQDVDKAAQLATRAAVSRVQIQLGAFTDRAYTEAEWRRISAANADLLGGRALAIQSTVSNGARYYRLRVGPFSSRDEASQVCSTLKSRGQDCIVANNS